MTIDAHSQTPTVYQLRICTATGPFNVHHRYVDVIWTPITGPTVIHLLRAVVTAIDELGPNGCVTIEELSSLVGVAPSRAVRAIRRANQFGLIRSDGHILAIPASLHRPPERLLRGVPLLAQRAGAILDSPNPGSAR